MNILNVSSKWLMKLIVVLLTAVFIVAAVVSLQNRNIFRIERINPSCTPVHNENRAVDNRKSRDPNIPWLNIFKFVPNNVHLCSALFKGNGTLPEDFMRKFKKYGEELARQRDKRVQGYTALFPFDYKAYNAIAKAPFLKTVCETGFNAGHSTFGWLTTNPRVHVYSFDIGTHGYSRPMAAHLQKLYPGRLNVTWGDSTVTLPKFRREHPDVKCDLIIIDGGHSHAVCKEDFYNFKDMANIDNILILDDYPTPGGMTKLGDVWEQGKQKGELSEFFSCNYDGQKVGIVHGFAVGKYLI